MNSPHRPNAAPSSVWTLFRRLRLHLMNRRLDHHLGAVKYHYGMREYHASRFRLLVARRNAYADYYGLPARPRPAWLAEEPEAVSAPTND